MKTSKLNLKLPDIKAKLPKLTKTKWILIAAVTLFLLLDIVAGIILLANKNKSAVRLVNAEGQLSRLYALDSEDGI